MTSEKRVPVNYRKKPIVIQATQWFKNGDHPMDDCDMFDYPDDKGNVFQRPGEGKIVRYYRHPAVPGDSPCEQCGQPHHVHGWIDTLEQGHRVCPGDWIIRGVKGELYPCKDDIFRATYELAAPAESERAEPANNVIYTTDGCPEHHGMSWETTVSVAWTNKACPLCERAATPPQAAPPTPQTGGETLTHTRSCPRLNPMSDDPCTCGLAYRIEAQTAETISAANRKRYEEAERELSAAQAKIAALTTAGKGEPEEPDEPYWFNSFMWNISEQARTYLHAYRVYAIALLTYAQVTAAERDALVVALASANSRLLQASESEARRK